LRDFASQHNLLLFQPLEMFRKARQDPPLFFGYVGHMTRYGHELVAKLTADFIAHKRLLPKVD
jgi:hypothetical protein